MSPKRAFKRVLDNHLLIFFLNFFLGWATYNLKLVSIVKLIEDLSLKAYPLLMLAQGVLLYFFMEGFSKLTKKSPRLFYFSSFAFTAAMVFAAHHPYVAELSKGPHGVYISCLIFMASTIGVIVIELSVKDLQSKNVSVLKNPNISGQLCFVLELGIIFGAVTTLVSTSENSGGIEHYFSAIPFLAALPIIFSLFLSKSFQKSDVEKKEQGESAETKELNVLNFPFVPALIGLFTLLLASKFLQGFAVVLGIIEFNKSPDTSVSGLYSIISIIQTSLILVGLTPSLFNMRRSSSWGAGVKIFLGIQTISMFLLIPFGSAYFLVGTGMLRKLTQHIFLNRSLPVLDSTIPYNVRFAVKKLEEKAGHAISYIFMAFVTAPVIYGPVPKMVLWMSGISLAIVGFYYRKKLLKTLNDFQIAHLVDHDVYDAMNACYSLANKESGEHYMALVNVLKNNPRPLMAKAIIFALGKMEKQESVPYVMDYYKSHDREDVQLVAINALLSYPSHRVDLFFQRSLNGLITNQTSLGELRISVFQAISVRIPKVSILTLMDLLEVNKDNQSVLANTVSLLGEMAKKHNDQFLFDVLSEYLDEKYSRRVRANAILYLFQNEKYRRPARECLDTFLTSSEFFDRTAVAFLAGNLRLKGLLPYVLKNSIETNHQNSTLLISLLKLDHFKAAEWFLDLVLNQDEENALISLNQLNTVQEVYKRYAVYGLLLEQRPEKTSVFLELLRRTKRNFDLDRSVIRSEAKRLGIEINANDNIFTTGNGDEDSEGPILLPDESQSDKVA